MRLLQAASPSTDARWISPALSGLAAASVLSHIASVLLHLPQAVDGAMLAVSLLLFGLLHGASTYGWRGILFFVAVCLGISNALENLSILTGFPFGSYHYSDAMGPKLFLVPLLIGPLYFGVGYLSWTLARAILGDVSGELRGALSVATPVIASFIPAYHSIAVGRQLERIRLGRDHSAPARPRLLWNLTGSRPRSVQVAARAKVLIRRAPRAIRSAEP